MRKRERKLLGQIFATSPFKSGDCLVSTKDIAFIEARRFGWRKETRFEPGAPWKQP